jgi:hypothetical protein
MDMMERVELLQALGSRGDLRSGFLLDRHVFSLDEALVPTVAMLSPSSVSHARDLRSDG